MKFWLAIGFCSERGETKKPPFLRSEFGYEPCGKYYENCDATNRDNYYYMLFLKDSCLFTFASFSSFHV